MRAKTIYSLLGLLATLTSVRAEVIPPVPNRHFNDYANVVSSSTAAELDQKLEQFERETSSQIVVVIYPRMQSESSIEDYTVRVAHSWGVGQKGRDNGAVLFVFIQDRKMYLQVGYGLEGALPDALAKRIIENEIKPHFRKGDFDSGLRAGVTAILQATRGEYKAIARPQSKETPIPLWAIALVIGLLIVVFIARLLSYLVAGTVFTRGGRTRSYGVEPIFWGGFGGGGGSGGGFSSGGGGFSAGGGGFGGGGAGGSW